MTWGCVGDTAPAGVYTSLFRILPQYSATTPKKQLMGMSGEQRDLTTNQHLLPRIDLWNSAAAITRLTFTPNSGANWRAGSSVTVYGLAAA
jgi:hypothetical protein